MHILHTTVRHALHGIMLKAPTLLARVSGQLVHGLRDVVVPLLWLQVLRVLRGLLQHGLLLARLLDDRLRVRRLLCYRGYMHENAK